MISPQRPIGLVMKWQKMASIRRKRIFSIKTREELDVDSLKKPPVAEKGHFVVYTSDKKRFEIPLLYLNNNIFIELLKVSEEEFGLSSNGPITMPCDAIVMGYIISLIHQGGAKGLEKALLNSITTSHCSFSASFHQVHAGQYSLCGY